MCWKLCCPNTNSSNQICYKHVSIQLLLQVSNEMISIPRTHEYTNSSPQACVCSWKFQAFGHCKTDSLSRRNKWHTYLCSNNHNKYGGYLQRCVLPCHVLFMEHLNCTCSAKCSQTSRTIVQYDQSVYLFPDFVLCDTHACSGYNSKMAAPMQQDYKQYQFEPRVS